MIKSFSEMNKITTVANVTKPSSASALIAMCFDARTKAHIAHLQTTSYAQHIALNEFYDNIVGLTDAFAESYQGRFGIISQYPAVSIQNKDGLAIVKELRNWIDTNRSSCSNLSELQNDIDAIVSQCDSTIYKLTNLS